MKLDLDRTPHGRSELRISGPLKLAWGPERPDSVQVQGLLQVDNLASRFLVNGKLEARGQAECARCLAAFELVWDVPVEIMVLTDVDSDEGEGDTLVIRQKRGEVDLDEPLRECLVLAFPAAPICHADCRGLCPQCGADLNQGPCGCRNDDVDPRWAGLDALE